MLTAVRSPTKLHTTDARLRLLRELWSDLEKALGSSLRNPTAIAVHDARVAARHLRALLRSLRDEANPAAYGQLRFDLTNLGREFAEVRTADMHLETIDALLADNARANAKDRTSLHALLERMATSARQSLARRMQSPAWQQRIERIDSVMREDDLVLKPLRPTNDEFRAMLASSIAETLHALRKRKTSISVLHKQRIRIKSTRYVCETLSPLIGSDTKRLQGQLNKAQDVLGEIHDQHALAHWLKTVSIPTPLAKPLAKLSKRQQSPLLKKFQRGQASLQKCLRKAHEAVGGSME